MGAFQGFGGTNAHAIIESYQPRDGSRGSETQLFSPLTFSANSEKSLSATLAAYLEFLTANENVNLRDLAWTLQSRRSTLAYRKAITGSTLEAIKIKLAAELEDDKSGKKNLNTRFSNVQAPRVLGVFTGQGAQWPRMGAGLLESSSFVQERISELDDSLASLPPADRPSWSLREEILASAASSRIGEAAISQPLCTAVQIVLVDVLRAAGIELLAVVGHSSGTWLF